MSYLNYAHDIDFDLSLTGFSIPEVDLLIESISVEEPNDPEDDILPPEDTLITIIRAMTIRRRGQEMKMVIGGDMQKSSKPNPALTRIVVKAFLLKTELESGAAASIKVFAAKHGLDHADAKRMRPLGCLAPDIVESILAGTQPKDLTAFKLKNGHNLPILWAEQRVYLGFAPKT